MNNESRETLINRIHVLSMTGRDIAANRSVLVRDGIIAEIGPAVETVSSDIEVIDGAGRYLMPGLVNMHVHLGDNPDDLRLYLAQGFTTIRNMWGYEGFSLRQWLFGSRVFNHLKLREQIRTGEVIGPDIYTAGPLLDGDPPFFPKFMSLNAISRREQVERIIADQSAKGYDFLKIYSNLSQRSFDDIIEVAGEYEMPVVGHIPDAVSLQIALEAGMRSIEHLYGFINPYYPERNTPADDIARLAAMSAEKGVFHCPTLVAHRRLANLEKQVEFEAEEQMNYVPGRVRRGMRMLIKAANKLFRQRGLKPNHEYLEELSAITRCLRDEGAKLLLGTDKSVPYVVAGFSEFEEMSLLRQAGLSNFDVLQAATVNAAECLRTDEFGTIETGKRANLLFTEENPLEDPDTLIRHAGVMKAGRYYSRPECDELLASVKRRAGH